MTLTAGELRTGLAAEIRSSLAAQETLLDQLDEIAAMADAIVGALRSGGTVLAFGNGGSAADAEHLATELVCRYTRERAPYAALALSANSSLLTASANDYGFEQVFARQVTALTRAGDIVIGISTSGRSPNVSRALSAGRERGAVAIALTGRDGGDLPSVADVCIRVRSDETPRIQEAHRLVIHLVCARVESALAPDGR